MPAHAAATMLLGVAWAVALAPVDWIGRAVAGFVVVLLAPGFLLDRRLGNDHAASGAELPARALTFSLGLIGLMAVACTMLGLSIVAVDTTIALVSFLLALAQPRARETAPREPRSSGPLPLEGRIAAAALIVLTLAAATLAALDVNLARDRMWYGAYVTHLAGGGPLDWHEPMLATGNIAWRFAYNAWIAALAAWSSIASAESVALLERIAPPLLVVVLPSSAFALARALTADRARAVIVALCSLIVLLASAYPYFSPERYAFFARMAEDKTAALVLLCPVAVSLGIDALEKQRSDSRDWIRFVLALVATALTHAIVFFIACASLAVYAAARVAARRSAAGPAVTALVLCAVVAIAPALLGVRARGTILEVEDDADVASAMMVRTDPVVRAHLRMERLRELPAGGPIVEPHLLADPLLVVALLGLVPALAVRQTALGSFACATTLAFLALAFVPFVAPTFGRVVVPWMAYRALWGVPFGVLLGALVLAPTMTTRVRSAIAARALTVTMLIAVAALAFAELPWSRASTDHRDKRVTVSGERRRLLAAIAELPKESLIAAAPGLAELIPAYAGRAVLAFSDRGTVALAGSRGLAEQRLIANAAIVGLHGASMAIRRDLIARHGVTHVIYEDAPCDLDMRPVHSGGRFWVCEVPPEAAPGHAVRSNAPPLPISAQADEDAAAPPLASLRKGIRCQPAPEAHAVSFGWLRSERWSAKLAAVTCRARFSQPAAIRAIRVRGRLPLAREALVFRVDVRAPAGSCTSRSGVVELSGESPAVIDVSCRNASEVTVRLVPAFLPYLNLRDLEVAGERRG